MEGGGGMIELQHVSFFYPDSMGGGLRDVTLTIPDGQCVLLCGRSGCGKTTLTRLINGLIPQFFAGELTGRVLLDGEDVSALPLYRIAEKVGSVFQNPRTQFFNVDADSEIASGWRMRPSLRRRWHGVWRRRRRHCTLKICWAAASLPCPAAKSRRSPSPRSMR